MSFHYIRLSSQLMPLNKVLIISYIFEYLKYQQLLLLYNNRRDLPDAVKSYSPLHRDSRPPLNPDGS